MLAEQKKFTHISCVHGGWYGVDPQRAMADRKEWGGCPRGVMVKAMDCGIVVSEFVLQSRYYVQFRANTLGKGMNLLILPAMG